MYGGNLYTTGGSINSGGGVETGGAIHTGGAFPGTGLLKDTYQQFTTPTDGRHPALNPELMYGHLLKMLPHEWEVMRHTAGELLGGKPHPFIGPMDIPDRTLQTGKHHYQNIINMAHPVMAARMLLHDQGGGFFDSLKHVFHTVTDNIRKVGSWFNKVSPHVATGLEVASHIPTFQPYADKGKKLLGTATDINNRTQSALNVADHLKTGNVQGAIQNYADATKGTRFGFSSTPNIP